MSTSLLYHGFGLRGVEYKKTEYKEGKIIFWIEPKPEMIRCPTCHSHNVYRRGQKVRRFRSVPIGKKPVEIHFRIPRVSCKDCGELRQIAIPFADPRRSYTHAFERYALELSRSMTIEDVAQHLGISWDVIKGIVKRDLQQRFAHPPLKSLRQIAIDEIAIAKGHTYVTVVMDLETGAIVFVGEGKGADALLPFWKKLRAAGSRIQAVATDMSPAYIDAVSTHLPNAFLVFDHFHLTKLFNDRLSHFRREVFSQMKLRTQRTMLKGIRWLLLKNPENLNPERGEKERLEEALQLNHPLATAYYMKDLLRSFWDCGDYQEATAFLDEWIAEAKSSNIRMLYGMAKTLERHRTGLLNFYHYPISTGPLEGTNNKIKTMKRQAYGFRDQEFFKLKIMAIHQCKYSLVG